MLSVYDLYDLHAILVSIRFCPDNKLNTDIITRVIGVLEDGGSNNNLNQFRIALQPIALQEKNGLYDFALIENKYCYFPLPFLKNQNIFFILICACKQLLNVITEKNAEKIYDLADCLHDLPILIAKNNYSIPKKYWNTEVKYYRKKWDANFLVDAQKQYQKVK